MTTTMDIDRLLAESAITQKLGEFARVLDEKRWNDLNTIFADDLSFDYGTGSDQHGLDALTANMRHFLDGCGPTQHLIGSIIITATDPGHAAVSRAYVQARHQRANNPLGPIIDTNGEYVDQWQRRADGWRIIRRDAIWSSHHGDMSILQAAEPPLI